MIPQQILSEKRHWITEQFTRMQITDFKFSSPIAEADFREYYRISHASGTLMLMCFLQEPERIKQVAQTNAFLAHASIRVPKIYAYDATLGLALTEDFGIKLLSDTYNPNREISSGFPVTYEKATDIIGEITRIDSARLKYMDENLLVSEMQLFTLWLLDKYLGAPTPTEREQLENYYRILAKRIFAAPQCCVHLDFHSHNLCVLPDGAIGVLDYQDIICGHFCYDLASLLYDAYVDISNADRIFLLERFYRKHALKHFNINNFKDFEHQFRITAAQRFIRVCGTFVRLWLRDGKEEYKDKLQGAAKSLDCILAGTGLTGDKKQDDFFISFWEIVRAKILPAEK